MACTHTPPVHITHAHNTCIFTASHVYLGTHVCPSLDKLFHPYFLVHESPGSVVLLTTKPLLPSGGLSGPSEHNPHHTQQAGAVWTWNPQQPALWVYEMNLVHFHFPGEYKTTHSTSISTTWQWLLRPLEPLLDHREAQGVNQMKAGTFNQGWKGQGFFLMT